MRRALLLLALPLCASLAFASATDRSIESPGAVIGLARSSFSVAFTSGPSAGHCGARVELWELAGRGVFPLGRHTDDVCREGPSGGAGIVEAAVAGRRVVWLAYAGGNLTDWSLETATTTSPIERELAFEEVDADASSPILLGVASDIVIPYAVRATVTSLAASGKRLYSWKAPAVPTALTAYGNQVAVFMPGGKAVVLSSSGAVAQSYIFPRGAVALALAGAGLVVQLPHGAVQIRKGPRLVRALTLTAGARMIDFAEGILLYAKGQEIHGVRVSDGKDVLLRKGEHAVLEPNGLSYTVGRFVYSVAMVNVLAAFSY